MSKMLRAFGSVVLVMVAAACGSKTPATAGTAKPAGSVHMALNGSGGYSTETLLATLVIQNVFDTSQNYLVNCNQKPHSVTFGDAGLQNFCDELITLPPGVYELIVQSQDPNCHSELNHYKVVVEEGKTTEILVNMICGSNNGGLDVIVNQEFKPGFDHIDFNFADGGTANKFVCQATFPDGGADVGDGGPNANPADITATVTVIDPDATTCPTAEWLVNDSDVIYPPLISTSSTGPVDGGCEFSAIIGAASPAGDYNITLNVTDDQQNSSSFTFPIHLTECQPLASP